MLITRLIFVIFKKRKYFIVGLLSHIFFPNKKWQDKKLDGIKLGMTLLMRKSGAGLIKWLDFSNF